MSPFFKLLASASSLAIVTSSFLYSKVAEAFDSNSKETNVPVVRVDSLSSSDPELSEMIDAMVDAKDEQNQEDAILLAQAPANQTPPLPVPGLPDAPPGPGGGLGPGGGGPPGLANQGNQGNPDFTGNAGGDAS